MFLPTKLLAAFSGIGERTIIQAAKGGQFSRHTGSLIDLPIKISLHIDDLCEWVEAERVPCLVSPAAAEFVRIVARKKEVLERTARELEEADNEFQRSFGGIIASYEAAMVAASRERQRAAEKSHKEEQRQPNPPPWLVRARERRAAQEADRERERRENIEAQPAQEAVASGPPDWPEPFGIHEARRRIEQYEKSKECDK